MATSTSAPESSLVVPTPLAGESYIATKQTMAIDNCELVVQGPQGATKISRPPITEAVQGLALRRTPDGVCAADAPLQLIFVDSTDFHR
jgi:hypothetical protein